MRVTAAPQVRPGGAAAAAAATCCMRHQARLIATGATVRAAGCSSGIATGAAATVGLWHGRLGALDEIVKKKHAERKRDVSISASCGRTETTKASRYCKKVYVKFFRDSSGDRHVYDIVQWI